MARTAGKSEKQTAPASMPHGTDTLPGGRDRKQRQQGRNPSIVANPQMVSGVGTGGPKITGSIPPKPAMRRMPKPSGGTMSKLDTVSGGMTGSMGGGGPKLSGSIMPKPAIRKRKK